MKAGRWRKKAISILVCIALMLGGGMYRPVPAKAAKSITMAGTTIVYDDLTVEYDGKYHALNITITGSTENLSITIPLIAVPMD